MDFISIIGTIASVGGIPLAIYLFIRSKEYKQDKIKREIVRILSHQIGDGRELSNFEIEAVINSKLRENKLKPDLVEVNEVIEDLITEIISNPLIENEKKNFYLLNLNKIFSKSKLYNVIENFSINETILELPDLKKEEYLEKEVKQLLNSQKEVAEVIQAERGRSKLRKRTSTLFGFIALLTTLLASLGAIQDFNGSGILEKVNLDNDINLLLVGFGASLIAGTLVTIVKSLEK